MANVATGIATGVFPEAVVLGLDRAIPGGTMRRVVSLVERLCLLVVFKVVVACVELLGLLINILSTAGRRMAALL